MPWKVMSLMSERHEFCQIALQQGNNFHVLCKRYGISRKTGYKWLKRYRTQGYDGLRDISRKPHRIPDRTDQEIEDIVVHIHHQYPSWGPRKLHALMKQELVKDICPSLSTVTRILKRYGLVREVETPVDYESVEHFERPFPNDLWQMDLKGPLRFPDGRKVYAVGILDDHSRYLVGLHMIADATDDSVLDCWIDAASHYGLPAATLTDHGAQFRMVDEASSAFRVHLWACGVRHTQGRVAHPQTQGKIERFWRTLNTEVLRCHSYGDLTSWQSCFDDWRHVYNHVRPHQAIGDIAPARLYIRSLRAYKTPDQRERTGELDSVYRRVSPRGQLSLSGKRFIIGRGFRGWTVELRSLGTGCWHVYFRNRFIKELLVTS